MLFVKCLFSRNKNFSNGFQSFFWVIRCIFTGITVTFTFWTTNGFINHTNTVTLQTFSFAFTIASFALTCWVILLLLFKELSLVDGLLHYFFCFYQALFAIEFSGLFSLDRGKDWFSIAEAKFGRITLSIDSRWQDPIVFILNDKIIIHSIRCGFFRPSKVDSFWDFILVEKFFRMLLQVRVPCWLDTSRWFIFLSNC